ncbi:hypothetical protein K493DRAFT_318936 [Basidiobolus meristosporus CBS 931.73]|uniref:Uncharacterized protein n=1 Tax=Basidiobolus meristosporus CBS 931.73 TaxID=1314790 RepID=A0A1Y1XTV3_9FUNG|nr:hypothetical protein K493DRAFT_318936 [Basidiobolus meristosporus CBS 931.73]|eukprot:ORX89143.1 hypothetical protein K493DRAFT_318936 [Basidiobolus meristosporus CBS 931.73]
MSSLMLFAKRSNIFRKPKSCKAHPLTQENLMAHNILMPPAKESKRARVAQYVKLQSNFNQEERTLHHAGSKYFKAPSIHSLEDLPSPHGYYSKDLDDSVSMMGRRRRKVRLRLWINRIMRTLKHLVPRMGKTHSYQSQHIL